MTMPDASWKLVRWRLRFLEFKCAIVHCADFKSQAADTLWRNPTNGIGRTSYYDNIPDLVLMPKMFV